MFPEPLLLGYPLSQLILYFVFYSCAGWLMETTYCSILEKRFVPRGFLHGPLCPIYGAGVLMMILFFEPLAEHIVLFYLVSTVCMSAWEYFVGWFLEVTTHVKYWDYSMYKFNLKGRICLWVCLMWGVLSYVAIFWIHPPVAAALGVLTPTARQIVALSLTVLILADAIVTIRELALMTKVVDKLQEMGGELGGKLEEAKEAFAAILPDSVGESAAKARAKYSELVAAAEKRTRRFRHVYAQFRAPKVDPKWREAVLERAKLVKEELKLKRSKKS